MITGCQGGHGECYAATAMRRALLALASLAILVTTGASCLSPTLPLPPPVVTDIQQASTGTGWEIFGTCEKGAIVTVFDAATGHGVVVEDLALSGQFHVTLQGSACDAAWTRQEANGEESPEEQFVLTPVANGFEVNPQACP